MRILICHNEYRIRAGEARVVAEEKRLLELRGHDVRLFLADNTEVYPQSISKKVALAVSAIYSKRSRSRLAETLQTWRPDVAHVHNTWFQLSPSIYLELYQQRVPTVQTQHNYRWFCAAATFQRNGHVCLDCLDKPGGRLHSIIHRCYHNSRLMSGVLSATQFYAHTLRNIYRRYIDRIIVHTEFIRQLYLDQGFKTEQLRIKPNFMPPLDNIPANSTNKGFVFLGRLDPIKGVRTLLTAATLTRVPITIIGSGPLYTEVAAAAERLPNLTFLGPQSHDECLSALRTACAMLIPSEWYESFPMTFVEAMAAGKPVIASALGSLQSLVQDSQAGLLIQPGNASQLAAALERLATDNELAAKLSLHARQYYEAYLTPEQNYVQLMSIYHEAIQQHRGDC